MKKLIQASGLDDEKGLDPNQITSTSASSTPSNSFKIRSGRSSNRECLSDIVGQDVGEASLSWIGIDNTEHRGTIPKQILPLTRCEEGPIVNLSHKDLNERLPNTSSASSITQSSSGDGGTKDCIHPDEISTACRINETYSLRLQTPVSLPKNLRSLQDPANIDAFNISGKEISLARMRRRNMVKTNNVTLTRKNATLHGETNAQEESVQIFKEANDIRNKEKSSNAKSDETSEFSSSKDQGESVSYKDGEWTHKLCNLRSYKLPPLTVYNHRSLDSAESVKTTEQSSKELPLKEYNTLPLKVDDQRSDTKVGQMADQTNGIDLSNRHSLTNKKGVKSHTYFKSDTFMAADKLCDEFYAILQNATEIENGSVREVGDNANDCSHSLIRKDESSFQKYETCLHRKELNAQFPDKKHTLEDLEGAGEGCCQKARWQENPPPNEEECPSLNSVLVSDVSDEFISCHGRICKLIMNFFFAPKKIIAFQEYPQFS
uniref:(California timema) hypothetical protein n=1 Tax=Timema californicum TaxID=61474 RepID=A0A7R9J5Q6_TIMCA|nr:unnamed protein product [Timema californicum]